MYKIAKEFHFSAAHSLDHLPETHQCSRLHGHNYVAVFTLRCNTLDSDGFVLDYGKLDPIKVWIDNRLDHRNLNDVMDSPSTAENLACLLYKRWKPEFPLLWAVTVKETPKTSATYMEEE